MIQLFLYGISMMGCTKSEVFSCDDPVPKGDSQTALGIILIDTEGVNVNERVEDRSWVNIRMSLIESNSFCPIDLNSEPTWNGPAAMHIRGNSSSSYEKKQYAIEGRTASGEDDDLKPFGLPSDEDWVLIAPYSDKTLMRNHLMFKWSRAIGMYAPRTHFVELYMDQDQDGLDADDYRGVYVFAEKIKRGKDRVNVEKMLPSDTQFPAVTGGYILKRDWLEGNIINTEVFDDELVVVYPKEEDMVDPQREFLIQYLNQFEESLDQQDGQYNDYIDLNSFADFMLMMELSRNVDAYVLSTYMHKAREGKLSMGPIWDFNGSLGNADYFQSWETEGWHYNNPEFPADNPNGFYWYDQLLDDPKFQSVLSQRWLTHRAGPWSDKNLLGDIDRTVRLIGDAQIRNFERWPIIGEYIWPNDVGTEERESYEDEISYLKSWISARAGWMDSQFN